MKNTIEASVGRWFGILKHFGIDEKFLRNEHGPCPLCGGTDRYRWDDKDGSGSYFCGGCGPGSGIQLVMKYTGLDFKTAADEIDKIIGNIEVRASSTTTDQDKNLDRLRKIHDGIAPMGDINPVRLYLRSRNLKPTEGTWYHPSMPYYHSGSLKGYFPAMLHLVVDGKHSPVTYHVTYLNGRGQKAAVPAPKKVMTPLRPMTGGGIPLYEPDENGVIGIAEGVETAMAVTQHMGCPCWAAYSATLLEKWNPPEGANTVLIYGDNDASFTGQRAAYTLAKRLSGKGYVVDVRIPDTQGKDWADVVGA